MKTKINFLLLALALLFGCQQNQPANSAKIKKGMIKVAILYLNGEGKTFFSAESPASGTLAVE